METMPSPSIWGVIIALLFGMCSSPYEKSDIDNTSKADYSQKEMILSDEHIDAIQSKASNWYNFLENEIEDFDLKNFVKSTDYKVGEFHLEKWDSSDIYRQFYIYSPDSTYFIDVLSRNLSLVKDESGRIISGDHDVDEFAIVINKNHTEAANLQFGADWIDDLCWADNNTLIMLSIYPMPYVQIYYCDSHYREYYDYKGIVPEEYKSEFKADYLSKAIIYDQKLWEKLQKEDKEN